MISLINNRKEKKVTITDTKRERDKKRRLKGRKEIFRERGKEPDVLFPNIETLKRTKYTNKKVEINVIYENKSIK